MTWKHAKWKGLDWLLLKAEIFTAWVGRVENRAWCAENDESWAKLEKEWKQ